MIDTLVASIRVAGGIAFFLLPGWWFSSKISSGRFVAAFLASSLLWFQLVLVGDALQAKLDTFFLAGGWSTLCLIAWFFRKRTARETPAFAYRIRPAGIEWWWAAAAGVGLASITLRAAIDPLSGWDNVFRWDHLAKTVFESGTLQFYPATTADDFEIYAWCDGIPPLVPLLNLWCYFVAGNSNSFATVPRVLIEAFTFFHATWLLATRIGGKGAGWFATGLLASSSIVLWGVAMGQETGLTAFTLVAMFLFLAHNHNPVDLHLVIWAGLAAGAGSLSREYGLFWVGIGLATLWFQGRLRSTWRHFSTAALAVASPWYIRNWFHTGNPLYSFDIGGFFPANPVHSRIMAGVAEFFYNHISLSFGVYALSSLAVLAGPLVIVGLISARKSWALARPIVLGAITVSMLWIWSVPQTAGGWAYSMRVLTPALALAAILAGCWLAKSSKRCKAITLVVLLFCIDAASRSWELPHRATSSPFAMPLQTWRNDKDLHDRRATSQLWAAIAVIASGEGIIVDHPGHHVSLRAQGARAIPIQSPATAAIFEDGASYIDVISRLRIEGIRLVLLTPGSMSAEGLIQRTPFLVELQRRESPVLDNGELRMFDLGFVLP